MPAMPPPAVIRIAAAIVTDAGGRLLLVRKAGTAAFMQPGGKPEPGESAAQALVRELREEIGVSLEPSAAVFLGVRTAVAANEPHCLVEAALFRVALAGDVALGAEIEELAWIDPREPGDRLLAPLTRDHVLPMILEGRGERGADFILPCEAGEGDRA